MNKYILKNIYYVWQWDTDLEIMNVCEEEEDKGKGNNPLAYCTGYMEGIVLHDGNRRLNQKILCI